MTSLKPLILCLSTALVIHAAELEHQTIPNDNPDITLNKFAYGACWKSTHSQKHWPVILENEPQLWLWLGDNIYSDTQDMDLLKKKYGLLGATEGYQDLVKSCPVIATWDDHDYGANDAGVGFPKKKESQKLFLEFFNERADSPRNTREGVYTSYYYGSAEQRVQIILLDTRYFRSALKKREGKPPYRRMGKWLPDSDPTVTMLGDAQWQWLEKELKQPAKIRLIATSIQFAVPHHGHETWANMTLEKQRMIDLIKKTKAEGVIFLSGDIHSSELCIAEPKGCYPLVDFTSSSLNIPLGSSNTHQRTGPAYGGANFGLVEIDWKAADPVVRISTKDTKNQTRLHHAVRLSELTFADKNVIHTAPSDTFAGEWQTFYGPMTLTAHRDAKVDSAVNWTGKCADRSLNLKLVQDELHGTWQGENRSGKVIFKLSRDGRFLRGKYSDDDLPLQLDWSAWKPDWEKHFKRDDYHLRKKKKK